MKTQAKNSYSMTLRLPPTVATDLENTAHDLQFSKTGFVRRALLRALMDAKEHDLPQMSAKALRGARQQ